MSRTNKTLLLSVGIFAALFGFYFFWPAPAVKDHMCIFVRENLRMVCPDILASTSLLHPGSIVDFSSPENIKEGKAPIPTADLLNDVCRVPGAKLETVEFKVDEKNTIVLPQFKYDVSGALKAGLDLPVPQLEGMSVQAGPKFKRLSAVEITNEGAWLTIWDENAAAQAITGCNIKKSCIDRILQSKYRVVSTTAIVKGLSYRFSDSDDKIIQIGAQAPDQVVKFEVGGTVGASRVQQTSVVATVPLVLGMKFLPESVLNQATICTEAIVFASTGSSNVSLTGGGRRGHIGGPFTKTATLNEVAEIFKEGTEQSECQPNLNLTRSRGAVSARVEAPNPISLVFKHSFNLRGGHFDTVASCVLGQSVGTTGHDNSIVAEADMEGTISVTLRTDSTPRLKVGHSKMPEAHLQLTGPDGKEIQEEKGADAPGVVKGDGAHFFSL